MERAAEFARKWALALAAMLLVARACWPGEGTDELTSGQGIAWVLVAIGAVGIALASVALAGRRELHLKWCDLAVIALFTVVGWSAWHAADRRIALNLAWQWIGVGLVYLIVRFLPHNPGERRAFYVVLIATATALAGFGLYQVLRLYPEARAVYRRDPAAAMRMAGVTYEPGLKAAFEQRLLGSQEPISTFSLANSLAGFLLAPVVIAIGILLDAAARRGWRSVTGIVSLLAVILGCLLLTKSRTAYAGLAIGCGGLVWRKRSLLPMRAWIVAGVLGLGAIVGLVVLGLATRQLDTLVLLESVKSLRYRWEYWVGTIRVLFDGTTWLKGLGPGNFAGPYLIHKLPEASEGIKDPHNALLEVWETAGIFGLVSFVLAIAFGLATLFARKGKNPAESQTPSTSDGRWLVTSAGVGGLVLAMMLRPDLSPFATSANPFEGDLERWLVLGVGWAGGAWLTLVATSLEIDWVSGSAAALCALVLNLMGAGGIGFAPVAMMLWITLALGVNATQAGVARPIGRGTAIVLLMLVAALMGTFAGTIGPAWAAEDAMAKGERLQNSARVEAQDTTRSREGRLLNRDHPVQLLEAAGEFFQQATRSDRFASRPWTLWAAADLELWRAKGASPYEMVWHRVRSQLKQARTWPRDPNAFAIAATEYQVATQLLATAAWPEAERKTLQRDRLAIAQRAARLNPTSAQVLANLSVAAEERGDVTQALEAARRALQLDKTTPHPDRKLTPVERKRLTRKLDEWTKADHTKPKK